MEKQAPELQFQASRKQSAQAGRYARTAPSTVSAFPATVRLQAQLETTRSGDVYEREADRMADFLVGGVTETARPVVSAYGGTPVEVSEEMEQRLSTSAGKGQSIPSGLRAEMESGFDRSFSDVRIHTDAEAAAMSRSLGARAFTYGNDIYFNKGQYQPETSEGRHLIAHELTHTVQQNRQVARQAEIKPDNQKAKPAAQGNELLKVTNQISELSTLLTNLKGFLYDLPRAARVAKGLAPVIDGFKDALPAFRDYCLSFDFQMGLIEGFESASMKAKPLMDPSKIAKGVGAKIMGPAGIIAWLAGNISTGYQALKAYDTSIVGGVYYTVRFLTGLADHPFPIPFPTPSAKAVLMTFNLSSTLGDMINEGLDKIGYNAWKQEAMMYMSEKFGGPDTIAGDAAAFVTGIPIVGDVAYGVVAGGEAVVDTVTEAAGAVKDWLFSWF